MTTSNLAPEWLSVADTATLMAVSTITVRRMIADGTLPATYFTPRTLRINRAAVEKLAKKNSTAWGGAA